mgnify:CR=1 FL=1
MKQINEEKIYELLGIKLFKKAVFKLEKIIHRKDKGKNINYHIKKADSVESVNSFKKYLYYNGGIHLKNLILGISALIMIPIIRTPIITIPMSILLVKDIYCVMLQRYNWLKLQKYEKKLLERRENKINIQKENINKEELKQELNINNIDNKQVIENLKLIRNYILGSNEENIIELNDTIKIINNQVNNKKILKKEMK